MNQRDALARGLAHALLADAEQPGACEPAALLARASAALGEQPAWLRLLIKALPPRLLRQRDLAELAAHLATLPAFDAAFDASTPDHHPPGIRRWLLRPARVTPPPLGLHALDLPPLATHEDLADWLGLSAAQLSWLTAESQRWRDPVDGRPAPPWHYRPLLQPKASGGQRLIEAPRPLLKLAQRRLHENLLARLPVHEAAMAYVTGRGVRQQAEVHAGHAVLLRFDLRDFFPSIRASRIHALWRTLGYPGGVARSLTTLCCSRTPLALRRTLLAEGVLDADGARRLAAPHLPQGAPSSPALANLCCFNLDLRLAGLAEAWDAHYTRYADDLVFSGPAALRAGLPRFAGWVAGIAEDEGFRLHPRKTRCQPQHRRQCAGGVVLNQHPNLPREAFDRLKARLHQQALHGGPTAEQRAELLGHIAWARQLNPARGDKLMALFQRLPAPT